MSYKSRQYKTKAGKITAERKEFLTSEQLVMGSRLRIQANIRTDFLLPKLHALKLSITGYCSKFPSISNEKVLRVIERRNKLGLIEHSAIATPSGDHNRFFGALTYLYDNERKAMQYQFEDTKDERIFGLVFLSSLNDMMDSHNTTKGIADWLQDVKILKNDKNLDILPFHIKNYFRAGGDTSHIILCRTERIVKPFMELLKSAEDSINWTGLI